MLLTIYLSALFSLAHINEARLLSRYHSNDEILKGLNNIQSNYPSMVYVYTIGTSAKGVNLTVLAMSASDPAEHITLRPEVKYVGNIHGNEPVSRELLYKFITHLLDNYGVDKNITTLLDTTRIHIMPVMNPDGFAEATEGNCSGVDGRWNGNGRDLNRDFPVVFMSDWKPHTLEPETVAIMNWTEKYQFVLSAHFHGGAAVVNYPYDALPDHVNDSMLAEVGFGGYYSLSEDDDTFQHLARTYSFSHRTLRHDICNDGFKDGITNGADWYPTPGGMQDYNYVYAGCMEITVELTCCKYPPGNQLGEHWLDNKDALTNYLWKVHMGVKGIVTFPNGQPAEAVTIQVDSRMNVTTSSLGEYWKILLPGNYTIKILIWDQLIHSERTIVTEDEVLRLDIQLKEADYNLYMNPPVTGQLTNSAANIYVSVILSVINYIICIIFL